MKPKINKKNKSRNLFLTLLLSVILFVFVYPAQAGREINCGTDFNSCDGLVSYWKLNEASGNLVDSRDGNNGTAYGPPTYNQSGVVNSAVFFDGGSDYADCGSDPSVQITSNISIDAWVKPASNANGDFDYIASKLVHASNREGYALGLWSDNRVAFIVGQSWSNWNMVLSSQALQKDQWYHVAGTYDGANIKIYINGVGDGTQPYNGGIWDSQTSFLIGKRSDGSPYDGTIDELRLWNRALSPTEVKTAYNLGAMPVSAGTQFTTAHGTTDFESVNNMSSISNMKLANSYGSITWDSVNARLQDADTNVIIGQGFVSVDSDHLDSSWSSPATVSIPVSGCDGYVAYHADGVHTSLNSIKNSGTVCDAGTTPACANFVCENNVLTFDVTEFNGYGGEGNGGGSGGAPEFTELTYILALLLGAALVWYLRRNHQVEMVDR